MTRALLRGAALLALCALLVFAPEIFRAVSIPYSSAGQERVLLRIALCTQDADASASFYKAVAAYQKQHPAIHLRIQRVDAGQLCALPAPAPDMYCYPAALSGEALPPLLPLPQPPGAAAQDAHCYAYAYQPATGETLLCAVSQHAREAAAALALVTYLSAAQTPDGG